MMDMDNAEKNRIPIERANYLFKQRMELKRRLERNECCLNELLSDFGFDDYTIRIMLGNKNLRLGNVSFEPIRKDEL